MLNNISGLSYRKENRALACLFVQVASHVKKPSWSIILKTLLDYSFSLNIISRNKFPLLYLWHPQILVSGPYKYPEKFKGNVLLKYQHTKTVKTHFLQCYLNFSFLAKSAQLGLYFSHFSKTHYCWFRHYPCLKIQPSCVWRWNLVQQHEGVNMTALWSKPSKEPEISNTLKISIFDESSRK